jgi:hypothetical protein
MHHPISLFANYPDEHVYAQMLPFVNAICTSLLINRAPLRTFLNHQGKVFKRQQPRLMETICQLELVAHPLTLIEVGGLRESKTILSEFRASHASGVLQDNPTGLRGSSTKGDNR